MIVKTTRAPPIIPTTRAIVRAVFAVSCGVASSVAPLPGEDVIEDDAIGVIEDDEVGVIEGVEVKLGGSPSPP